MFGRTIGRKPTHKRNAPGNERSERPSVGGNVKPLVAAQAVAGPRPVTLRVGFLDTGSNLRSPTSWARNNLFPTSRGSRPISPGNHSAYPVGRARSSRVENSYTYARPGDARVTRGLRAAPASLNTRDDPRRWHGVRLDRDSSCRGGQRKRHSRAPEATPADVAPLGCQRTDAEDVTGNLPA